MFSLIKIRVYWAWLQLKFQALTFDLDHNLSFPNLISELILASSTRMYSPYLLCSQSPASRRSATPDCSVSYWSTVLLRNNSLDLRWNSRSARIIVKIDSIESTYSSDIQYGPADTSNFNTWRFLQSKELKTTSRGRIFDAKLSKGRNEG